MSKEKEAAMRTIRRPEAKSWGDVFWHWLQRGVPREEAAFRADEWARRRNAKFPNRQ